MIESGNATCGKSTSFRTQRQNVEEETESAAVHDEKGEEKTYGNPR